MVIKLALDLLKLKYNDMKDLEITKGEWRKHTRYPKTIVSVDEIGMSSLIAEVGDSSYSELIIDAGNTAQKCGFLPSELLEHLESIIDAQFNPEKSLANLNGVISNAREAIKKATNE